MNQTKTDRQITPVDERLDPEVVSFRARFDQKSPLDEFVRDGARRMLQAAIDAELEAFVAMHDDRRTDSGNRTASPLSRQGCDQLARQQSCRSSQADFEVMQASFHRAVTDGAKIAGVTAGVGQKRLPQFLPQTLQDNGARNTDTKKADAGNPVNNWECLASALSDLPISYPART